MIEKHLYEALLTRVISTGTTWEKAVAEQTGLLPIAVDMGGAVLLERDSTVSCLVDGETKTKPMDGMLQTAALRRAARRFPEVERIQPVRGADSLECILCKGATVIHGLDCSMCQGWGWVDS